MNQLAGVGITQALRDAEHVGAAASARTGEDIALRCRIGMKRTMRPGMRLGLALEHRIGVQMIQIVRDA